MTSIGEKSFMNCKKISSIYIPPSVTTLGKSAFSQCDLLYIVDIDPSSKITTLNDSTFYECSALSHIYFMQTSGAGAHGSYPPNDDNTDGIQTAGNGILILENIIYTETNDADASYYYGWGGAGGNFNSQDLNSWSKFGAYGNKDSQPSQNDPTSTNATPTRLYGGGGGKGGSIGNTGSSIAASDGVQGVIIIYYKLSGGQTASSGNGTGSSIGPYITSLSSNDNVTYHSLSNDYHKLTFTQNNNTENTLVFDQTVSLSVWYIMSGGGGGGGNSYFPTGSAGGGGSGGIALTNLNKSEITTNSNSGYTFKINVGIGGKAGDSDASLRNGASSTLVLPDNTTLTAIGGNGGGDAGEYKDGDGGSAASGNDEIIISTIGSSTFEGCSSLSNILIPKTVTSVGSKAFMTCNSPIAITFAKESESSLETIGSYAFANCDITTCDISALPSLTNIQNYAFLNNKFVIIDIPKTVTTVGESAYATTFDGIVNVNIHCGGSATIGEKAFQIENLHDVTFRNTTDIPAYTSTGSNNNDSFPIKSSAAYPIAVYSPSVSETDYNRLKNTFISTYTLNYYKYEDDSTLLGENLESNFVNPDPSKMLVSVIAGSNALGVSQDAFKTQTKLASIAFTSSYPSYTSSVSSIQEDAFRETAITSLNFPASMLYFQDGAFYLCTQLTEVHFTASPVLIKATSFPDKSLYSITAHVPSTFTQSQVDNLKQYFTTVSVN